MQIKRVFDTGFETFELTGDDGKVMHRVNTSSSFAHIEEALQADNITPDMKKKLTQWLKKSQPKEFKEKSVAPRAMADNNNRQSGKGFDLKTRDNKSRRTSQTP